MKKLISCYAFTLVIAFVTVVVVPQSTTTSEQDSPNTDTGFKIYSSSTFAGAKYTATTTSTSETSSSYNPEQPVQASDSGHSGVPVLPRLSNIFNNTFIPTYPVIGGMFVFLVAMTSNNFE